MFCEVSGVFIVFQCVFLDVLFVLCLCVLWAVFGGCVLGVCFVPSSVL